jgi:hypothetical protein
MLSKITLVENILHVHAEEISLKNTKAFTHGTVVFNAEGVTFASFPPLPLPAGLAPIDKLTLDLQLVGPDGELRKQTRTITLIANEKVPGEFRAAGKSKTESLHTAALGWKYANYKFRAYFTHLGIKTDPLPKWIEDSVTRQRLLWNALAALCRNARRACSSVPEDEFLLFIKETVLPAFKTYNDSLGRKGAKLKMKEPKKLKEENPSPDALWKLAGSLKHRIEEGKPVPPGLLEKVEAFTSKYKTDYSPLNTFLNNRGNIAAEEAKKYGLKHWEKKSVITSFESTLKLRKTKMMKFGEGWPRLKERLPLQVSDWNISYNFGQGGVDSAELLTEKGVPGLNLGANLAPSATGHKKMLPTSSAAKRMIRPATISIAGENKERWVYNFCVLEHRHLPEGSLVKEWKLTHQDGNLWLNLIIAYPTAPQEKIEAQMNTAGLDIGWRRNNEGIKFGVLYEPVTQSFNELTVDLTKIAADPTKRTPFRIDFGPGKHLRRHTADYLPNWKPGDEIPNAIDLREILRSRMDKVKDEAKNKIQEVLGDETPVWIKKVGRRGMLKMKDETYKGNPAIVELLSAWAVKDEKLGKVFSTFSENITRRIQYGKYQVAHDVARFLHSKGVHRLNVEAKFLANAATNQTNNDEYSLKNSQRYRQFIGVAGFVAMLKEVAEKYGIEVVEVDAAYSSRTCSYCGNVNEGTQKLRFECACGREIDQDQNAAIIISRSTEKATETGEEVAV